MSIGLVTFSRRISSAERLLVQKWKGLFRRPQLIFGQYIIGHNREVYRSGFISYFFASLKGQDCELIVIKIKLF